MCISSSNVPSVGTAEWDSKARDLIADQFPATILRALVDSASVLQVEISSVPATDTADLALMADRLMRATRARSRLIMLLTELHDSDGEEPLKTAFSIAEKREMGWIDAAVDVHI